MIEIPLTRGQIALIDDEDYELVSQYKWCADLVRNKTTFYAKHVLPDRKPLLMHRLIMGITDYDIKVDHEDHDGLNNQKYNLRPCTSTQNQANKLNVPHSSKYKGVYYEKDRNKWRSQIQKDRWIFRLGRFDSEIDAAKAYDKAAIELFGKFALINFPEFVA